MKNKLDTKSPSRLIRHLSFLFSALALIAIVALIADPRPVQAACPALPTTNGVVTQTVNVASTGTYRVWSRIMAPDSTSNSYYLEIDDTTCGVNVGDGAITSGTWTWVDYQGGNTATKTNVTLSAGNHTFRMVGREAGVKLDRILLISDSCVPTGTGANCDGTPPATSKTGDLNNDNLVNIFDLSILLSNYGKPQSQSTNSKTDLNNDNTINIFDLSILLSNYGK